MSGGTPVETECKQIGWIYGIHGENTRDPVYCQHQRNYQGWLFTEWFFDSRSYPTTEHVTVPTQIQTYRGFPVWVRWAEIVVSDNVKVVDFDATYIHRVKIEIGENSQIEAIHIPKTVTSLTVKVADGYKGDVVFYMESDNPRFKDSWSQSYYKPHYKKCVFIVPKGSEELYKSIGRFQFARIYTSIEEYRTAKTHGNKPRTNTNNNINTSNYVDLGLPSGILWNNTNENGLFSYEEAMEAYGANMPSIEHWKELVKECKWSWQGNGYYVVGPNGKSLFLSASGNLDCRGSKILSGYGPHGYYWSSTPSERIAKEAWILYFTERHRSPYTNFRCYQGSVRLISLEKKRITDSIAREERRIADSIANEETKQKQVQIKEIIKTLQGKWCVYSDLDEDIPLYTVIIEDGKLSFIDGTSDNAIFEYAINDINISMEGDELLFFDGEKITNDKETNYWLGCDKTGRKYFIFESYSALTYNISHNTFQINHVYDCPKCPTSDIERLRNYKKYGSLIGRTQSYYLEKVSSKSTKKDKGRKRRK